MKLLRAAWKLLVGIKDALVLAAMLLFFGALFAALSARPNPSVKDGALLLRLNGSIVEQPEAAEFSFGGSRQPREFARGDLVRALEAAKGDARVKAVVLDLDGFEGGLPATLNDVADALRAVRAAGKPVLAYATAYSDSGYRLAAQASEIWVNPMGGVLFTGQGGSQLYYKQLFDKLGVNIHVYRVGKYKSAVEPFSRQDQSPEAAEELRALYGVIGEDWARQVAAGRPQAKAVAFRDGPAPAITAAGGDVVKANRGFGLVDQAGDELAFGKRVAALAGAPARKPLGSFNTIKLDDYLAAHPLPTGGDAVGVLTIAGDVVDGRAPAGTAGAESVSRLLLDALAQKKLKALVVRLDTPGGSALAGERMRQAILEAKRQKLPVIVSMGGLAASAGYWIATTGDVIYAQPATITGSIGIFGILPSFEGALTKLGIGVDGVKTAPLAGQPDVAAGFNPALDAVLQAGIEHGYREFLGHVAKARGKTLAQVDAIGQGRVWDGGTARQLGLVDRFGGLDAAIAEAARRAGLDPKKAPVLYLEKKKSWWDELLAGLARRDDDSEADADREAWLGGDRTAILARVLGDMRRLARGPVLQARCLECMAFAPAQPRLEDERLLALLLAKAAQ